MHIIFAFASFANCTEVRVLLYSEVHCVVSCVVFLSYRAVPLPIELTFTTRHDTGPTAKRRQALLHNVLIRTCEANDRKHTVKEKDTLKNQPQIFSIFACGVAGFIQWQNY